MGGSVKGRGALHVFAHLAVSVRSLPLRRAKGAKQKPPLRRSSGDWCWSFVFRRVLGPGLGWWTEMTLHRTGVGVPICASSLRWALAWGFWRIALNASGVYHWA
jgi:hypothetical protein